MHRQIVQRNFIVNFKRLRELPVRGRWIGSGKSGGHRDNHNSGFSIRELAENCGPGRKNLGVGRHRLAWQHIESREKHGSAPGLDKIGESADQRVESFSLLIAIDDDDLRAPRGAVQQG
jgi:hypothetical protein